MIILLCWNQPWSGYQGKCDQISRVNWHQWNEDVTDHVEDNDYCYCIHSPRAWYEMAHHKVGFKHYLCTKGTIEQDRTIGFKLTLVKHQHFFSFILFWYELVFPWKMKLKIFIVVFAFSRILYVSIMMEEVRKLIITSSYPLQNCS